MDSTFNFTSSDDEVIVAKSDDNGQAVGSKKLYQPFRQLDVAPDVAALQRPNEEKLYILLYYNIEYEEYKFAKFHGRYNTYFVMIMAKLLVPRNCINLLDNLM